MKGSVSWTKDQEKAIRAKGQDILVAAAAGSGKTAVLVERIIEKIIDEKDPVNVDELLVVTFTNLSAQEMRQRIGQALEKKIAENPGSKFLRRQLSLLNQASISTIHSFCLEVIKKFYYLIDLDPNFRILDETEGLLLRDEAMDAVLEEEYGKEGNEEFFRVADMFTGDRSDSDLADLIMKLYDFSRATPNPDAWLANLPKLYDAGERVDDLPYIHHLMFEAELQLKEAKRLFGECLELARKPAGPRVQEENFLADLQLADALLSAKNESFSALYEAVNAAAFTKLKPCKGDEYDPELTERAKKLREKGKQLIQKLKNELFSRKPETFLRDLREMKKPVETLVSLVRKFAEKFAALKKERALADFSDLEHYCMAILGKFDPETNRLEPTEAALYYQKKFKEVLVDEYQDTNMVQESILQLVKRGGEADGNLFMVGDVKQSIYRFRLAEPKLFLDKYHRFRRDGMESGLKIDLSQNFRSRKEILDGTNFIFKQIMDEYVGEIAYDESAELKPGAAYPQDGPHPVEVALLHTDGGDEEPDAGGNGEENGNEEDLLAREDLEQSQLEAKFVAQTIRKLIDEKHPVYDPKKGASRPVQYRDIVILLRSFTWAPQFLDEFKQYGIPAYADLSSGYFQATEVETVLSLLKIIDNPFQDIPLASVLRSPIVGLSEDDLARIRIRSPKKSFYEAVKTFSESVPETDREERIHQTVKEFLRQLSGWRSYARTHSLSELIWRLYRDTKYFDFVGGLPGGRQRRANLLALFHRARQYEETSFRGLFRFLRFVERMTERGNDFGEAKALGEQEDVVRLMTIHSSKGLEFPVVFVAGLGRSFNMMDLRKDYLLDKDYGFAVKYMNPDKQITYPSIFQLAVLRKKKLEFIAEEMRILYVAMTRAKEKLYLVGSTKDLPGLLDQWRKHADETGWVLDAYDRLNGKSYLHFIGPCLIRHRDGEPLREEGQKAGNAEVYRHPAVFQVSVLSREAIEGGENPQEKERPRWLSAVKNGEPVPEESSYKSRIEALLRWEYPHRPATVHNSKQSVSELKRRNEPAETGGQAASASPFKPRILERPKFLKEKKLSPAEKGTAMHLVMQHIDLSKPPLKEEMEALLSEMQRKELLTEEERRSVDTDVILGFFQTDLGRRLIGAKWVKRELPFSLAVDPREIYPDYPAGEDPVFVQGIIDCLFKDEKGLVLLDYKTDAVTGRFPDFQAAKPVLLARYRTQIAWYKRAIEEITREKMDECYLFFFDGGHLVKVDV